MAHPNTIQPARGEPRQSGASRIKTNQEIDNIANNGSPPKRGLVAYVNSIFGRGSTAANTEHHAQKIPADGNGNALEEAVREQEAATHSVSTPNLRKRPARRDIYQVPDFPDEQAQDLRVNNLNTRARTTVKPKKATVPPKRSLRNNRGVVTNLVQAEPSRRLEFARNTRSNHAIASSPASSRPNAAKEDTPHPKARRPRGRPRKNPLTSPKHVAAKEAPARDTVRSDDLGAEIRGESDDNYAEEEEQGQPEVEDEQEVGESQADDGISEILMNPSPVKPIPATTIRESNGLVQKAKGRHKDNDAQDDYSDISDNGIMHDEPVSDEDLELDSEDSLIKEGVFDKLIQTADRVGHHYDRESKSWTKKSSPNICSSHGKRFMRRAQSLLQAYKDLQGSMMTESPEGIEKSAEKIADLVEKLNSECQTILSRRLGNPALGIEFFDQQKTRNMLQDIYFHINPSLLQILKAASEAHPPKRSMEQASLRHLYLIITMLSDLASTALIQPREHQPIQQSKSDSYNVSKPTSLLKPKIEKIKKVVAKEFTRRELVQKALEGEILRRKRARRAEEQERREEAEIRQRRKEIRRKRREAYDQLISKPYMSRLLKSNTEARNGHGLARHSYSADHVGTNDGPDDIDYDQDMPIEDDTFAEDDPFAEAGEDEGPRLSLFGTNNTNDSTHARPLSEEEKGMFVECMMFEHGDDRYVKAADTLERSMEEIFAFAQDLQEAMDRKHEQGQLNGPQDEWTYDIWDAQQ